MKIKQPSIFVQLEKYKNISVRELGRKKLGENTVNVMETIEIIDTEKSCILFQIQVPLIKSWKVLVRDIQSYVYDYENVEDAYEYSVFPFVAMRYELLFPSRETISEIACENQMSELEIKKNLSDLEERLYGLQKIQF